MNVSYSSKNINDEIRMIFDSSYIKEMKEKETVHISHPIGGCIIESGKTSPIFFQVMGKNLPMSKVIQSLADETDPSEQTVHQYIEENYLLFWSGFITKGLKNNVGVDGHFMSGDLQMAVEEIFSLRIHNMNVSHKSNVEEVLSRPCLALVILVPSNPTQKLRFQEYRSYFKDKKIIGIINHFRNKILYIFPYYDELKELLGGLKDGSYMVGMVSEIIKKDEPALKSETQLNLPEGALLQNNSIESVISPTSKVSRPEIIENELYQKTLVEEVDVGPDSKTDIFEEINIESGISKKMLVEDIEIDKIPSKKTSPLTKTTISEPIEIEVTATEDLTEEIKLPDIVTQIEETDE